MWLKHLELVKIFSISEPDCFAAAAGPWCSVLADCHSTMSTSDSDYSIDWLASDEDDYDSPKRLSPQDTEEPPVPPLSSSSPSALRESPTGCFHCGATRKRRRRSDCCECKDGGHCGVDADCAAALQTPAVSPLHGFTSVYTQQMLSVQSQHHSSRKRAHSAGLDGRCEKPPADTENELFSQKVRVALSVLWTHDSRGTKFVCGKTLFLQKTGQVERTSL